MIDYLSFARENEQLEFGRLPQMVAQQRERLRNGAEPNMPVEGSTPRVICAWCPDFNPRDPANKGASHGICPTCAEKMKAEIDGPSSTPCAQGAQT